MHATMPHESQKSDRTDPRGFVLSLAVTLFAITLAAVVMMQLAH